MEKNMSSFIETNQELPRISFDEQKFRDLQVDVYTKFRPISKTFLNGGSTEKRLIGQALQSNQYFADAISLIDKFVDFSCAHEDPFYRDESVYRREWGNFAWALFLENREAIERSVQHISRYIETDRKLPELPFDEQKFFVRQRNKKQALGVFNTITHLVNAQSNTNQDDVAIDFLIQNAVPVIPDLDRPIDDQGVLEAILGYGNDEQVQFARKFILDALDDQDSTLHSAATRWVEELNRHFLGLHGSASKRLSAEKKIFIDHLLDKWHLTNSGIVEDWQNITSPIKIVTICNLEAQSPGIAETLHSDFGISHFSRYPSEILLRQYEQRDEVGIPYGVIIYPKADHNGAFASDKNTFAKLLQQADQIGYALRVAEVDSKQSLVRVLNRFRRRYGKIAFAVIGGHGEPDRIRIGLDNNRGIIYTSDVLRGAAFATRLAFEENPTLILASCSTGAPDGIGQEIANLGTTVIAPKKPTSLEGISVKKVDGQLQFDVSYRDRDDVQIYRSKVAVANNK